VNKIIWFTGLSSAGKTTIALKLMKLIDSPIVLLDGDIVRKYLSPDLGYSIRDRNLQMDRLYGVSKIILLSNVIPIVCTNTAPFERMKDVFTIYIKCNVNECIKRDVKHLYNKALKGEIRNLPGIDLKYKEHSNPEIIIETDKYSIDECVNKIYKKLKETNII